MMGKGGSLCHCVSWRGVGKRNGANSDDTKKVWLSFHEKVATVLGSIPVSSDTVEYEWRKMRQGWINPRLSPPAVANIVERSQRRSLQRRKNNLGLKCSLRHWQRLPNLFLAPFPIAYVVNKRPRCVRRWQFVSEFSTAVRGGAESWKGSHKKGDGWIFLKTSSPLSLIKAFRMNLISAGFMSLDSACIVGGGGGSIKEQSIGA